MSPLKKASFSTMHLIADNPLSAIVTFRNYCAGEDNIFVAPKWVKNPQIDRKNKRLLIS